MHFGLLNGMNSDGARCLEVGPIFSNSGGYVPPRPPRGSVTAYEYVFRTFLVTLFVTDICDDSEQELYRQCYSIHTIIVRVTTTL